MHGRLVWEWLGAALASHSGGPGGHSCLPGAVFLLSRFTSPLFSVSAALLWGFCSLLALSSTRCLSLPLPAARRRCHSSTQVRAQRPAGPWALLKSWVGQKGSGVGSVPSCDFIRRNDRRSGWLLFSRGVGTDPLER